MNNQTPAAVVLGASPTGLYAIRELAHEGISTLVVDTGPGCAFHSKHVGRAGRYFAGTPDAIERWLLEEVATTADDKPVLVPTSDVFIEFILQRSQRLAPHFRYAPAYDGDASQLLDKSAFHALCQQHGMATPGVWNAANRDELLHLSRAIPYPCILKPVLIHRARDFLRGKKVLLARDRDEFVAHVEGIPDGLGGWLVQEIIPGPESDITLFAGYMDRDGQPRQTFTARKLRQYPPGFGSASLVASEPCPETMALTLDFLQRIGFRGICGAEYKRDPRDGKLKIIEINPRPTLWFQAAHDAGKRIVEAAVRDLAGGVMPPEAPQDASVRWRYGLKDAVSARFYRRDAGHFIFPPPDVSSASSARKRSWPVFDTSDPLPALFEPLGYLRKAWGRMAWRRRP